jgi:secreted trypsin-like serine protease
MKNLSACILLFLTCATTAQQAETSSNAHTHTSNLRATAATSADKRELLPQATTGTPRIIDGQNARQGRFPYFVRLAGTCQCGAALIAPDVVVTAAHCEGCFSRAELGQYNTNVIDRDNRRGIVAEVVHPEWAPRKLTPYNDVMLVKLDSPASPDWPIVRLNGNDNIPGATGTPITVIGFGSIVDYRQNNGDVILPTILQETTMEYVSFEICQFSCDDPETSCYGLAGVGTFVTDDWFCTMDSNRRSGTCRGDSGGPLILEGDSVEHDLLVATVSGAAGCANPILPDQNERVSYHYDWYIEEGCKLSDDPPDYWACPGAVPTDGPITPRLTPSPTVPPTLRPTPPRPSPSPPPTAAPQPQPGPALPPIQSTSAPQSPGDADSVVLPLPKVLVFIRIVFDFRPQDIGWCVADENARFFQECVTMGAYRPLRSSALEYIYLNQGQRYRFEIMDSRGDGMSFPFSGLYSVGLANENDNNTEGNFLLVDGGGNFGSSQVDFFTVPYR